MSGERVVCPWHHACFDLADGRQVEPPGQDSLPAFEELLRRQEVPAPGEIVDTDLVELLRAAGEEA